MNKTNTDLRELLDRLSVYVEPKTIKEFEGVCRFYIKRDYLPRTEAFSRKDAVSEASSKDKIEAIEAELAESMSKREVERIIDYSPKTQLEDSENQDTYHEGYEQCLQDMKDLLTEGHSPEGNQPSAGLTEVDKPNKEN